MFYLQNYLLKFMKFLFSFFLIYTIFLSFAGASKTFESNYLVKTKGITIGTFFWNLNLEKQSYKTTIDLKKKGFFSKLFVFEGYYQTSGTIKNKIFSPEKYSQFWKTNKKERGVEIDFYNSKISKILINPKEKELPRLDYKDLYGYSDPITSFINILINEKNSYTIDGRRLYLLVQKNEKDYKKITIKEYKNIWADHKRNDLEFIEIYQKDKGFFPEKINIRFDGSTFSLIKN